MPRQSRQHWRPLSQRHAGLDDEPLLDGVPPHLTIPIQRWLNLVANPAMFSEIALRLQVVYSPPSLDTLETLLPGSGEKVARDFCQAFAGSGKTDKLLDAVDMVLHQISRGPRPLSQLVEARTNLTTILELGGSLWTVSKKGDALEQRVSTHERRTFTEAAAVGGSPGQHMETAWAAVYGRHPNPTTAYSEAIKSVEAAAAPIVTPNDKRATLGTIRGALQTGQWEFAIHRKTPTIDPVLSLITMLWEGQSDRHGGIQPTLPITPQAARAAVHAAVLLVQWFSSSAIAPKS